MVLVVEDTVKTIVTIAGSDSGGGAGIQADLKTFAAQGFWGLSVITALTAQNTQAVKAIYPIPTHVVVAQLEAIWADFQPLAVKIGMLGTPEVIQAVGSFLRQHCTVPVVIDPVLQSSTGTALTNGTHLLSAYSEAFWGLNTLFTPNIPEAESLLKIAPIQTLAAAQTAAVKLTTYFPNILLKGGHLPTTEPLTDTLMVDGEYYMFPHERIEAGALHGTGCTLASAIVAHWANGLPLPDAVAAAQSYIRQAILTAPKGVGQGRRVLNHFPQTNLSTQIKQ